MKRKTLIVFGGSLVAVCLVAGWYRLGRGSQDITLRFVGYEAAGDQRWLAVFRATNSTPDTVFCHAQFQSELAYVERDTRQFRIFEILPPHSDDTWRCPVPDTNSVRLIEITCQQVSPFFSWANDVIVWLGDKFSDHRLPLLQGRWYGLTCSTEAE